MFNTAERASAVVGWSAGHGDISISISFGELKKILCARGMHGSGLDSSSRRFREGSAATLHEVDPLTA